MMALYMFFTGLAMPAAMVQSRAACLCFEPEPAAGDYDCELFGIFAEYSARLCLCLRQIRHARRWAVPAAAWPPAVVFWFNALVLWLYVAKQQYFRQIQTDG